MPETKTAAVTGLNWGGGVFVNYAFLVLWAADVTWLVAAPRCLAQRAPEQAARIEVRRCEVDALAVPAGQSPLVRCRAASSRMGSIAYGGSTTAATRASTTGGRWSPATPSSWPPAARPACRT